jgi:heme oxygenase (mycobilin-producing)
LSEACVFLVRVRLRPDAEEEFLQRYGRLADRVAQGLDGHVAHRLCQDRDEHDRWVIESHWESYEAEEAWERTPEHRELTMAMRECWAEAERTRYTVRRETLHP